VAVREEGDEKMLRIQKILRPIIKTIFHIFCRVRVEGAENLPEAPPYIIFPNHISWFDPPLIGAFVQGPVHFMTMDVLFKFRPLGYLLRLIGGFPVSRQSVDRRSIEEAVDILQRGGIVCIFPEGGIGRLKKGQKLRQGISLIAQLSNVALVPIGISGCRSLYNPLKLFTRRAEIIIRIGEPFLLSSVSHLPGKKTRLKSMERIGSELCTLAREEVFTSS
jgi:1-acyl-sn-glycerol-3-phosphate acyltransferase